MRRTAWIMGLIAVAFTAEAAESKFPREVARWWAAPAPPPASDPKARHDWFLAANYSDIDWYVTANRGWVLADQEKSTLPGSSPRPAFLPEGGRFVGGSSFARVDDGWLVGFNHGEFGAALYWFSRDGKQNYKVSDHQVVDFYPLPNGIHAIEGLAHLGMSRGSIIRVDRPGSGARWQATRVTKLPFAPYAVSVRHDGTQLSTLSDALVSVDQDGHPVIVLSQPLWSGLYPTSSVLSTDERRLYIGMRQYVVESDLATKAARYLVPAKGFINLETTPLR